MPKTRSAAAGKAVESGEPSAVDRQRSLTWAQRLKRVFAIDIEVCRRCGGKLKVIASIEDLPVIGPVSDCPNGFAADIMASYTHYPLDIPSSECRLCRTLNDRSLSIMTSMFLSLLRLAKSMHRAYGDPEFRALISIMIFLLISGTIFYSSHEDWGYIDALYFCVMTMSTVGYGDLAPTSNLSKIFTMVYSLITIGVFVGVASKLARAMLVPGKQREE